MGRPHFPNRPPLEIRGLDVLILKDDQNRPNRYIPWNPGLQMAEDLNPCIDG